MQEVTVSDADVTSAISHHDRSQMMTELLPIFQVIHALHSTAELQQIAQHAMYHVQGLCMLCGRLIVSHS